MFPAEVTDSPIYDEAGTLVGIVGISWDVSQRKREKEALQQSQATLEFQVQQRTRELRSLSARLLQMRDDERRRLARELHDSFGQQLTAIVIDLDLLAKTADANQQQLVSECRELLQGCLRETRTLSHLLHPPLLDELGFASAARWYVEGFAQRSGIEVEAEIPEDLGKLGGYELTFFRILQEALTNVHRHSQASRVFVLVEADAEAARLTVKDNGCGVSPKFLTQFMNSGTGGGIGLAGMRERVRDAGGKLELQSDDSGTTLLVSLPVEESTSSQQQVPS